MKKFLFDQCSIKDQFGLEVKDKLGMLWWEQNTADFFRSVFATLADVVKFHQSKDKPRIGLTLKDDKGNFKFGTILVFQKPEEDSEEDSGNWYLQMTFDPSDMTDLSISVDNHSDMFVKCAEINAHNIAHGRFKNSDIMFSLYEATIDTIYKFLDKNADPKEEVQLEFPGIFTASVEVVGDEKTFSLVPGEYIKQLVKNDSAL